MGSSIKERRIELGKGTDEIAAITRIRESYLKAIEEEDFPKLPIEVYSKGYIREYAKYLGVPSESLILRYEEYLAIKKGAKEKDQPSGPSTAAYTAETQKDTTNKDIPASLPPEQKSARHLEDIITETFKPSSPSAAGNLLKQKAVWIIPVAIIAVIAYLLISQKENVSMETPRVEKPALLPVPVPPPVPETQEKTVVQEQKPAPVTPQPAAKPEDKTKTAPVEKPKQASPEAIVKKKKHNLEITATDRVWLQVVIDGSDKKELMMNAGDKINYGANESINVLVGNAAGTKLRYDGKDFENLGEKGQVVRLNFPEGNSAQTKQQTPGPANP